MVYLVRVRTSDCNDEDHDDDEKHEEEIVRDVRVFAIKILKTKKRRKRWKGEKKHRIFGFLEGGASSALYI